MAFYLGARSSRSTRASVLVLDGVKESRRLLVIEHDPRTLGEDLFRSSARRASEELADADPKAVAAPSSSECSWSVTRISTRPVLAELAISGVFGEGPYIFKASRSRRLGCCPARLEGSDCLRLDRVEQLDPKMVAAAVQPDSVAGSLILPQHSSSPQI
jgi:hypothetical protein